MMGDDGVGNYIVEELIRRNNLPGLRLIAGETDAEYCLEALKDANPVILIDASDLGSEPCSVAVVPLKDAFKDLPGSSFSHQHNLIYAVKQRLDKPGEDGILIAVEVCSINCRFGLSPRMEAEFSRITDEVLQHIETYLSL